MIGAKPFCGFFGLARLVVMPAAYRALATNRRRGAVGVELCGGAVGCFGAHGVHLLGNVVGISSLLGLDGGGVVLRLRDARGAATGCADGKRAFGDAVGSRLRLQRISPVMRARLQGDCCLTRLRPVGRGSASLACLPSALQEIVGFASAEIGQPRLAVGVQAG